MSNWPPFVPYLILAVICGLASFGIAFFGLVAYSRVGMTEQGLLTLAGMVAAPAVMGIGIAANMPHDRR
jgi:hypothetical protein